jgi:cell division protein ZapA
MAEVMVTVSGRPYRLACADGEEERLAELGRLLDARIGGLRGALGDLGDMRLLILAGIALIDEVQDASRDLDRLRVELAGLSVEERREAGQIRAARDSAADLIGAVADRLEGLAREITDEIRRG